MGRIEIELGRRSAVGRGRASGCARVFGIANFSYAGRGPARLRRAGGGDPRRPRRSPAPTSFRVQRAPGGQAVSVHVAADRARGRRPDQGGERAGASISTQPALTIHIEMLPDARVLLLRQGAGRRRPADRHRRPGRVPAVGRHRLAGGGVSDDAARLLGAAHSLSQLPDPVARVAGEGARDRGAADAATSCGRGWCSCRSASCSSRSCSACRRSCASSSTGG